MGTSAEELSTTPRDIEATRADLSRNIDELSDKVSPHRVVERRKAAVKGRMSSMRDRVMGTASGAASGARDSISSAGSSVTGSAGSAASSVTGTAQSAVGGIESRVEGNPLAAGLVAFGAGMVISALLPASEKEARAAGRLVDAAKEHGQPMLDEAKSVGQQMGHELKDSAVQAAEEVKSAAQDSAQTVKDEATSSAQTVKDQARP